MSPEISIIIPVYNVSDVISDTLACVLSQSYADFELILVDDGSTDGTIDILRDFCQRDGRIRLITQENAGPAAARNTGIDAADGRYIMFLDSDDTIQPDALSRVMEKLGVYDCDLMIFGFRTKNVGGATDFVYTYQEVFLPDKEALNRHFGNLYQNNLLNQVWNKAYRASLLKDNHCRFQDYRYGEDRLFVFDVLPLCNTIYISDQCLYNYFIRSKESLVSKFYDKKFEVCNRFDRTIKDFQRDRGISDETSRQEINYMYLKSILSCETNLFLPSCPYSFSTKKAKIREILSHEQVRSAVREYRPRGFVMNTVVRVIKTESSFLNIAMASSISFVSRHFSTAFIKAKHPEARTVKS